MILTPSSFAFALYKQYNLNSASFAVFCAFYAKHSCLAAKNSFARSFRRLNHKSGTTGLCYYVNSSVSSYTNFVFPIVSASVIFFYILL